MVQVPLMVGLGDLKGPFQPNDSMILWFTWQLTLYLIQKLGLEVGKHKQWLETL